MLMSADIRSTFAMIKYVTIACDAEAEQIIDKSRFLAHISRVDTREAAEEFISGIRKKYKDATHNVPAFVMGEKQELQWASDDGEPSGTAGAPMLQMLVKEGLTNTVIVVTRYFGGIKLGTGGLVRAYTGVAREALQKAGRFEVRDILSLRIKIQYSVLTKIQKATTGSDFNIVDILYEDEPVLTLEYESEKEEDVLKRITDLTMGNYKLV